MNTDVEPLFRIALVGAGLITRLSHLPAALASPLTEVAAIVDQVVARAAELAASYGIAPRIAASVEEILHEVDGAVIATPNDTHGDIAVRCLAAGVPVLIEKPLASSYQQGLAIVNMSESTKGTVAVGYSTRFRSSIVLLKELLDAGYFGAVRRFAHQFGTPGGWSPLSAYNLARATAGGGVLVVTGTHFLDRMLYLWGYPDEALLEDDSLGGPEANCVATFRYRAAPGPFEGVARYSKTAKLPAGLVIETESGYVVLADIDDAEIVFRPHGQNVEHVVRGRAPQQAGEDVMRLQLEDFASACRERRPPRVDGRQGLESLRLLEQLYAGRKAMDDAWYGQAMDSQVAA